MSAPCSRPSHGIKGPGRSASAMRSPSASDRSRRDAPSARVHDGPSARRRRAASTRRSRSRSNEPRPPARPSRREPPSSWPGSKRKHARARAAGPARRARLLLNRRSRPRSRPAAPRAPRRLRRAPARSSRRPCRPAWRLTWRRPDAPPRRVPSRCPRPRRVATRASRPCVASGASLPGGPSWPRPGPSKHAGQPVPLRRGLPRLPPPEEATGSPAATVRSLPRARTTGPRCEGAALTTAVSAEC